MLWRVVSYCKAFFLADMQSQAGCSPLSASVFFAPKSEPSCYGNGNGLPSESNALLIIRERG